MVAFGLLGRYFGFHFLGTLVLVFVALLALIGVIDFFEFARRLGERENASLIEVARLVLLRLPVFSEQMLPFAVLISAMVTFLTLSRRNEFIVARSAGISAWQFIASAVIFAALIGAFATTIYSPLSASAWEEATRLEAAMFERRTSLFQGSIDGAWVRQQSVDGQAIIQAQWAAEDGRTLRGLRIFAFDPEGRFTERVEAREAQLEPGTWVLHKVRVFPAGNEPEEYETYLFSTNLTAEQVRGSLGRRDALSFWDLPLAAEAAARAGLRTERYWLQYQQLLALPFTLVTMVVIAAAFSLRVFRLGGIGKMMLAGLSAGFLLYVATRLGEELGMNGVVPPVFAAWVPVAAWALMGCWVLLHQEDG